MVQFKTFLNVNELDLLGYGKNDTEFAIQAYMKRTGVTLDSATYTVNQALQALEDGEELIGPFIGGVYKE